MSQISSLFIFLQMQISSFWRMLSLVLNDEMLLNSQINLCNKSPVSHICISSKLPQWLLCFLVWPLGWLTGLVACCRKRCSSTVGVFSSAKIKTGNLHSKGYKALFQAKPFFSLHLSTFFLHLRSSTTILSFSCISKQFKDNQRDLILENSLQSTFNYKPHEHHIFRLVTDVFLLSPQQ